MAKMFAPKVRKKGNLTMLLVLAVVVIFAMLATISLLSSGMYKQSLTSGNLQHDADLRAVSEIVKTQGEAYLSRGFASGSIAASDFSSPGSSQANAMIADLAHYIPSDLHDSFSVTDVVLQNDVEFVSEHGASTHMDLIVVCVAYRENGVDKICNIGFFNKVSTGYFSVGNYEKGDFITLWTS